MPGFNRKGPQNKGPKTGGGRGLCMAEKTNPQALDTQSGEQFCRQGRGRGFGCINRKNNGMGQDVRRGDGRFGNRR